MQESSRSISRAWARCKTASKICRLDKLLATEDRRFSLQKVVSPDCVVVRACCCALGALLLMLCGWFFLFLVLSVWLFLPSALFPVCLLLCPQGFLLCFLSNRQHKWLCLPKLVGLLCMVFGSILHSTMVHRGFLSLFGQIFYFLFKNRCQRRRRCKVPDSSSKKTKKDSTDFDFDSFFYEDSCFCCRGNSR